MALSSDEGDHGAAVEPTRHALVRLFRESREAAHFATSVFTLNVKREAATEAPGDRIVLRDAREWVILLLDRSNPPPFESYRARISTTLRRPITGAITGSAVSGDLLALRPGLLPEGDYVLTLEGLGAGPAQDFATYRFRAVITKEL